MRFNRAKFGIKEVADARNEELYGSWNTMLHRCLNPTNEKYYCYGARGITVDPRWFDFDVFKKDMGPRPKGASIERVDVNKGYEPANCIWLSLSKQSRNRRVVKYSPTVARRVRMASAIGVSRKEIQSMFGIGLPSIKKIVSGKHWRT